MASSWGEAQREAMFKLVEGGFIFRVPGLFPRHYLVTEAQKAEIQSLMRNPRLRFDDRAHGGTSKALVIVLAIGLFLAVILLNVALALLFRWATADPSDTWAHLLVFYLCYSQIIILGPIRAVSMTHSWQIGRVLEGARQTEQRITLRERSKTYARLLRLSTLLVAGLVCALLCAFFATIAVGHQYTHFVPINPRQQLMAWFVLVPPAYLAVCSFYLAILKLSLGRSA